MNLPKQIDIFDYQPLAKCYYLSIKIDILHQKTLKPLQRAGIKNKNFDMYPDVIS